MENILFLLPTFLVEEHLFVTFSSSFSFWVFIFRLEGGGGGGVVGGPVDPSIHPTYDYNCVLASTPVTMQQLAGVDAIHYCLYLLIFCFVLFLLASM